MGFFHGKNSLDIDVGWTLLGELFNNYKLLGHFETLGNWILEMWNILSSQVWTLDCGLYFNSMHDNWVWKDLQLALIMQKMLHNLPL